MPPRAPAAARSPSIRRATCDGFVAFDLLKINQAEAQVALGSDDVRGGGEALRRELGARVLVITLGADGMLVFDGRRGAGHVAGGAGDRGVRRHRAPATRSSPCSRSA